MASGIPPRGFVPFSSICIRTVETEFDRKLNLSNACGYWKRFDRPRSVDAISAVLRTLFQCVVNVYSNRRFVCSLVFEKLLFFIT